MAGPAVCAFAPQNRCFQGTACFKVHTTGKSRGNAIARGFAPEPFLQPQFISPDELAAYKDDMGRSIPRARPLNAPAPTRMPKGYVPRPVTTMSASSSSSGRSSPLLTPSPPISASAPKQFQLGLGMTQKTATPTMPDLNATLSFPPLNSPAIPVNSPTHAPSSRRKTTTRPIAELVNEASLQPMLRERLLAMAGPDSASTASSATRLRRRVQNLIALSATSSALRTALLPTLLHSVGLDSLRSFSAFSDTLRHGHHVRRLHLEVPAACAYPTARILKNCPGLQELSLTFIGTLAATDKRGSPERLFDAIAELAHLRSLKVGARSGGSQNEQLPWTWSVERLPKGLENLVVRNVRPTMMGPSPQLRMIELIDSPLITPEHGLQYLEVAPELEQLTVRIGKDDDEDNAEVREAWTGASAGLHALQDACDERAIYLSVIVQV